MIACKIRIGNYFFISSPSKKGEQACFGYFWQEQRETKALFSYNS